MSEGNAGGGRTALVVAHTGRKDSLASAREVVSRLIEAGLTVRVLTPEAGDLACAGVQEVTAGPRAAEGAEIVIVVGGDTGRLFGDLCKRDELAGIDRGLGIHSHDSVHRRKGEVRFHRVPRARRTTHVFHLRR